MPEFDAGHTLGVDVGGATTVAAARTPDGRVRILPVLRSADHAGPGELLAAVATAWRRTVGRARPDVVLTHPHRCDEGRKRDLVGAAEAAGFTRVRVMSAPEAATAYFLQVLGRSVPLGGALLVHDLGATTAEVAAVARRPLGMEVVASDRRDVGGDDLDLAIARFIAGPAASTPRWRSVLEPASDADRRFATEVLDVVRAARERMGTRALGVRLPALGARAELSADLVVSLAKPVLHGSLTALGDLMRALTLTDDAIAGILLIGGTMRMPLLATAVQAPLARFAVTVERPDTVLAHGAAVNAAPPAVDAPARRWWRPGR